MQLITHWITFLYNDPSFFFNMWLISSGWTVEANKLGVSMFTLHRIFSVFSHFLQQHPRQWQLNESPSMNRDTQADLHYVNNYKPQIEDLQLRILLHGPVGVGKSSFINSVKSTLQGRMCRQALVDNTSRGCFTKKVQRKSDCVKNSMWSFRF